MNVPGLSSSTSRPPKLIRASSPWNFDSVRNGTPAPAARPSTNQKPALWRVRPYSAPGLPRPTMAYRSELDMVVLKEKPLVPEETSGFESVPLLERKIGRAHVCTPVTNAHLVCRLLLETKNLYSTQHKQ